jgi:tRNA G46 methylase TrmB
MNGGTGADPAQMLNSATMATAASCLTSKGRIVIVTDNWWYARLICATFVKVARDYKDIALRSSTPNEMNKSGRRQAESFTDPKCGGDFVRRTIWRRYCLATKGWDREWRGQLL